MNDANLIPNSDRTREQLSAMGKKGAQASKKKRRELRAVREVMREILAMPLDENQDDQKIAVDWLNSQGVTEEYQNQLYASIIALHRRALAGDVKAFETELKIINEFPAEKAEIVTEEKNPMMNKMVFCTTADGDKFVRFYGNGVVYELPDNGRDNREEWEPIEKAVGIIKKNRTHEPDPKRKKLGFGKPTRKPTDEKTDE